MVLGRGIAPDRVALETVDASLALLEIDRVRRQVPVDDRMAVEVEVEPLLAD